MPYESFNELERHEKNGVDFTIELVRRSSDVLIVAPHAGMIEPVTGRVARGLAGDDYSLYIFNALTGGEGRHSKMHIASHMYDEPEAMQIVREARLVVTVHGEKSLSGEYVMMGGLDEKLKSDIENEFEKTGIKRRLPRPELEGKSPGNICNRGKERCGVQLEISALLRIKLRDDPAEMAGFIQAVRNAIAVQLKT